MIYSIITWRAWKDSNHPTRTSMYTGVQQINNLRSYVFICARNWPRFVDTLSGCTLDPQVSSQRPNHCPCGRIIAPRRKLCRSCEIDWNRTSETPNTRFMSEATLRQCWVDASLATVGCGLFEPDPRSLLPTSTTRGCITHQRCV